MREHPQALALGRFVRQLDEVDQEGKHPLTSQQSAAVLQAILPLQAKENLDEETARRTLADLKGLLTPEQQGAIDAAAANSPFGPGARPGGGAGGSGPAAGLPPGGQAPGSAAPTGGGPAGGGPGAPAGAGPSGAATGSTSAREPTQYNPLSVQAPANNERAARRAERIRAFTARLEERAKTAGGQ
jgi:hypothetical protein